MPPLGVACLEAEKSPRGPRGTKPFRGSSSFLTSATPAGVDPLDVSHVAGDADLAGVVGMGDTTATLAGPGEPSSRRLVLGRLLVLE